ncbi:putative enterotoxin [Cordyceps sp. RAO-2017]|nr:putative enterotoxin [Cordyceps sp. RAO-2017]
MLTGASLLSASTLAWLMLAGVGQSQSAEVNAEPPEANAEPPEANAGPPPSRLYRGDHWGPEKVKSRGGFNARSRNPPRLKAGTLGDSTAFPPWDPHVHIASYGHWDTPWISTTSNLTVASSYSKKDGFVYDIQATPHIISNAKFQPDLQEYVGLIKIFWGQVHGYWNVSTCRDVKNIETCQYTENPDYDHKFDDAVAGPNLASELSPDLYGGPTDEELEDIKANLVKYVESICYRDYLAEWLGPQAATNDDCTRPDAAGFAGSDAGKADGPEPGSDPANASSTRPQPTDSSKQTSQQQLDDRCDDESGNPAICRKAARQCAARMRADAPQADFFKCIDTMQSCIPDRANRAQCEKIAAKCRETLLERSVSFEDMTSCVCTGEKQGNPGDSTHSRCMCIKEVQGLKTGFNGDFSTEIDECVGRRDKSIQGSDNS